MKNYCLAVFMGLATAAAPLAATAQNAPNIVGKYSATIMVNRLPQPVFFDIRNLKPGDREAATILYAIPRDCSVKASYGGYVDSTHIFYAYDRYGGKCESVSSAVLKLRLNEDRQLMYEFVSGSDTLESGLLTAN